MEARSTMNAADPRSSIIAFLACALRATTAFPKAWRRQAAHRFDRVVSVGPRRSPDWRDSLAGRRARPAWPDCAAWPKELGERRRGQANQVLPRIAPRASAASKWAITGA